MDVSKLNYSTEQLKALSEAVNAELSIKQDEKYTMVKLYNFSKKDFSHTWNSKNYFIKAGGTLFIQDYIAEHLAKHLINRELANKYSVQIRDNVRNIDIRVHPDRAALHALAVSSPIISATNEVELAMKAANYQENANLSEPTEEEVEVDETNDVEEFEDEDSSENFEGFEDEELNKAIIQPKPKNVTASNRRKGRKNRNSKSNVKAQKEDIEKFSDETLS